MTTTRVVLQSAFVLHSRPYRDTSLLVEIFTKEYGRLTVLARGVRKNSRSVFKGVLVPFLPLLISYSGKTELQTMQQVEVEDKGYDIKGRSLLCGFYLNELIIRLIGRYNPHPNVFRYYQHTLTALADVSLRPEIALRLFEKALLIDLGYGLQLDYAATGEPILEAEYYSFEFGVGFRRIKAQDNCSFLGKSLLALHMEEFSVSDELQDAKKLLRMVIANLLGPKPLKSRELFINFT